jgi:hypothetical protein
MTAFAFNGTFPASINPGGAIAGYYLDVSGVAHGFLRAPNGTFTTFDAPGAGTTTFPQGTSASNLNPSSAIDGFYIDASNVAHGYLRARNGVITTFDAPGAGTGAGQGTFPDQNDPSGGHGIPTLTGAVCITVSCGANRTNRNEHYTARCLGGFSLHYAEVVTR